MFVATLITIAKIWKKIFTFTNWWMNKQMCYIGPTECYTFIKGNEVLIQTSTWMNLGNIMLSERSQIQQIVCYMITLIWNIQTSERLLLNDKMPGFLASRGDEFNRGQRSWIAQSCCIIKFYWSIKEIEKVSDKGIRREQKVYPPASLLQVDVIESLAVCWLKERNVLKFRMALGPSSINCILW